MYFVIAINNFNNSKNFLNFIDRLKIRPYRQISNEELWKITNFEEIVVYIRRKKWKWIEHTLRKGDDELAKQALD